MFSKVRLIVRQFGTPILVLIGIIILSVLVFLFKDLVIAAPLQDFDTMIVSDGFHKIDLSNGQHFYLSYEQNHYRIFEGIVSHTNMDHESNFPILSFDILVTSGDFSDSNLVSTSVEDHHFSWQTSSSSAPQGTINLLHTIPMNQAIEERLMTLKIGDHVVIKGWDVLKIDVYTKSGDYVGYWEDSGCNTSLITEIVINP